jgi:type II secretory pathway pseudopilin PulG
MKRRQYRAGLNADASINVAAAFSLLEVLVAMAVLALMMVFMFNLVGSSFRAWESGLRQIEAAQAARVGLDRMASELQFAMAGEIEAVSTSGTVITNIIPFRAIVPSAGTGAPSVGDPVSNVAMPPGSGQLFAVAPIMNPLAAHGPFTEIGYYCAYNRSASSYATMSPRTYYLIWHKPYGQEEPKHDIYYRNDLSSSWYSAANNSIGSTGNRSPLIDNCFQMQLRFAVNTANGLVFQDSWPSQVSLPAGVLITLSVMDRKTAARIRQLRPDGLTSADLLPGADGDVSRILREGSVVVSRFVPFLNSVN